MGFVNGLTITGCSSPDQLYSLLMDYNKLCTLDIVNTYSFITSLEIEDVFELVMLIIVILILRLPCCSISQLTVSGLKALASSVMILISLLLWLLLLISYQHSMFYLLYSSVKNKSSSQPGSTFSQ